MDKILVVSNKDFKTLTLPKVFFDEKDSNVISVKAGKPFAVPKEAAKHLVGGLPQRFSYFEGKVDVETAPKETGEEFDADNFLIENGTSLTEEKLRELSREDLFEVAKSLELKNIPKTTGVDKLVSRILNAVNGE